jgi:oligopeptide transport system ATP-binding protein
MSDAALLSVRDLKVHFPVRIGGLFGKTIPVKAVDGVSFDLKPGETLGVVGESGCGKSTLGRAILQLIPPTDGAVLWLGERIEGLSQSEMRAKREDMQIIFQDPLASLNPRMTIGDIISEPLRTFQPKLARGEMRARVEGMLAKVGLSPHMINRYPHEFSGGQCQRVGVARAMILKPRLIVCDEPVSALDVSIQAQIINLLEDLQKRLGLTYLFIAHDLSVVRHISDRVAVMYLGKIVEVTDRTALYEAPRHPYTRALLSAVPIPDPAVEETRERTVLRGEVPSPLNPPSGCVFHPRCPIAVGRCSAEVPALREIRRTHWGACHLA